MALFWLHARLLDFPHTAAVADVAPELAWHPDTAYCPMHPPLQQILFFDFGEYFERDNNCSICDTNIEIYNSILFQNIYIYLIIHESLKFVFRKTSKSKNSIETGYYI